MTGISMDMKGFINSLDTGFFFGDFLLYADKRSDLIG
jgi:hypothetical protein